MKIKIDRYSTRKPLILFLDVIITQLFFYFLTGFFSIERNYVIIASLFIFFAHLVVISKIDIGNTPKEITFTTLVLEVSASCITLYVLNLLVLVVSNTFELFPPKLIILYASILPFLYLINRFIFVAFNYYITKNIIPKRRAILCGINSTSARLIEWNKKNHWYGLHFDGFFTDYIVEKDQSHEEFYGLSVLGDYSDIPSYVKKNKINDVYITTPYFDQKILEGTLKDIYDGTCSIYVMTNFFMQDFFGDVNVIDIGDIPAFALRENPIRGLNNILKFLEDYILSTIILLLISPILLIISIAIKLTSKGSVLFKQWRYGLDGKLILVWKFRTMTVTEDGYAFEQVQKHDARITPLGGFLRRWSLDELPQFINVIQGRLSIVGPRPHAVVMVDDYRKKILGSMERHIIKPGITGLAQIYGTRGAIHDNELMEERIRYDRKYIKNWSLFLDFKMIFLTIISLFHKEAY